MNDVAIETRGLVRRFGKLAAIDGVDLRIPTSAIAALVGPNGAGKSTLLNLLAGLIAPTEGSAEILRHPARQLPANIAPLVQVVGDRNEPPGSLRLSALAKLQGDAAPRFDCQWFQQLLLDHHIDGSTRFGTLSKGQRRWVLVALALASRPQVLLMDEPADGLDPAARQRLYELLRNYVNDQPATVLVSSHVLGDLERVADDVVILRNGRVALHESLETLRDEAREIALSYGEPCPVWLDQITLLAETCDGNSHTRWFRCPAAGHGFSTDEIDLHPSVRRVNLESLYLSLTQHASSTRPPAIAASEVQPCN